MTIHFPRVIAKLLARAGYENTKNLLPLIYWDEKKLHMHPSVSPVNTLFNVMSGDIYIDEGTYFGHNCMVLTGKHITKDKILEGQDIHIGKRCWVCSGSIILANVTIGDDCTIAAGSIVTKDVPPGTTVKGVW
jgi:acetyltransferase-like isoleucine patch superfamily enzyme